MDYEGITYKVNNGAAYVTINGPKVFNAGTDNIRGISAMGMQALKLDYGSGESQEGDKAFNEKRQPNFRRHTESFQH